MNAGTHTADTRFPDDKCLVSACLENNEHAWLEFQGRYTPLVYAIARAPQWRFNEEDIEDLCTDVFSKMFENGIRQFQFRSSLKTYVAGIARCACVDRMRSRSEQSGRVLSLEQDHCGGRPFDQVLESGINVVEFVVRKETTEEIGAAFNQLKDECRKLLHLRFREDMAYDQIAKVTNLPLGTVCSLVSRCTGRLIELIRPIMCLAEAEAKKRK